MRDNSRKCAGYGIRYQTIFLDEKRIMLRRVTHLRLHIKTKKQETITKTPSKRKQNKKPNHDPKS